MQDSFVDLSQFSSSNFDRGKPFWVEILWRWVSAFFFQSSWFPFYGPKRWILRIFGAQVGQGVRIKPRVTITFPWKLQVGDFVWMGENVWVDNLAPVILGNHVCLSQGAYLCTGNHDFRSPTFDLKTSSIQVDSGAWVAAKSVVGPGVQIGKNSVLCLGSVATQSLEPNTIYSGNPVKKIGVRAQIR